MKKVYLVIMLIILLILLTGCYGDTYYPEFVNMQAKVDGTYEPVSLDEITRALITLDYVHHEVHEGVMYSTTDTVAANTTTVKWQIHTANTTKYAHLVFNLSCTGEATFLVTEGSDRTDGTALEEVNRRRVGVPNVAETIVTRTPTGGSTDGALTIFSTRSGITGVAAKAIESGAARAENEWILKPNTKYVISITTYADVYVTCKLDWYEHIEY